MVDRLQRRHAGLLVYDPAEVLCDLARQVCPMTMAGKYLYSYGDHVSDTGNGRIADALLPLLVQQALAEAQKNPPVVRGEG
jgi:hypothetical protein